MTDFVQQKNIDALLSPRTATAFTAVTAGGAGNNVAVIGATIQRSLNGLPLTASVNILWSAVLGAANTLTVKSVQIEHSVDGANWTTYKTFTDPGVVATGPGGGGTVRGQTHLPVDLAGANDFIRVDFTPALSAANTDTASLVGEFIFAGEDRLPAVA